MIPLIRLDGVDVAIEGATILRDLRWCLRVGENWAVLGGNGSGKSTFLKLLRGELAPAPGFLGRRVYGFDGDEQVTAVGVKERIALVSPETQTCYLNREWSLSAREVIHSGFVDGEYAPRWLNAQQKERFREVVGLLEIGRLLRRSVQALSTGELRKVLIARALVSSPRILVCDEVCDGLDAAARAGLLSALDQAAKSGTQLVLTTHRSEELVPAITHRMELREGRILEAGPVVSSGVRRRSRRLARPSVPIALPDQSRERSVDSRAFIQIERANVFLDERRVLSDINFAVRSGEHWAVLGPNGAGKSTLLKLIAGDLHPAWGGRVRRFEFTSKNTIWEVKRRIGLVSPELQSSYRDDVTGLEAIASGFTSSIGVMLKPTVRQFTEAARLAERLGLAKLADKSVLAMSYGELRRILIARALVHCPDLLICDEPFDGLDAVGRGRVAALLESVAASGTSLVVVTHHEDDLPACLTHVIELNAGRVMFQGEVGRRVKRGGAL